MKPASPALKALLASRQFYAADLYTFTLFDGSILYYAGSDTDIVANGNLYAAGAQAGPYFDRKDNKAKCHWKVGVEVDSLVFDVLPGAAAVQGEPFLSACRQGLFDGAELQLERAFMPTYGDTSAGTVVMFVGRVAEIDVGRSLATFTVNSHLELLNLKLPRNLFQPGCVNNLGDASCTVDLAGFAMNGTVAAGSAASQIRVALAQPTGYFDLGKLTFTGGANSGLWRSVKSWTDGTPGTIALLAPFPTTPLPGDGFTIYPGCDKTQATCQAKFSNLANFRGFPFIPTPDTAV